MDIPLPQRLRNRAKMVEDDDHAAEVLLNEGLVRDLRIAADEIERLQGVLVDANNNWRHEFDEEVNAAAEKLFKKLAAHRTDPFAHKVA